MENSDELLTIAELAIGIAGFSGVIAAFFQRDGLHELDRNRFVNLFVVAFLTLVLAYTPIALAHAGLQDASVWRWSSVAMIFGWFINSGITFYLVVPAVNRQLGPEARRTPQAVVGIPSILNLGVQILNATGWAWQPDFVAYLFGLFVYLYAAGAMFVFVVLFRPPAS